MSTDKHRILLVDDEPLICKVIQRLLKKQTQFEIRWVVEIDTTEEVFDREGPFDVLLTDINLCGVSGADLAEALTKKHPALKVIFMSGDVPKGFTAVHRILEKPFDKDDLIAALERVLSL